MKFKWKRLEFKQRFFHLVLSKGPISAAELCSFTGQTLNEAAAMLRLLKKEGWVYQLEQYGPWRARTMAEFNAHRKVKAI